MDTCIALRTIVVSDGVARLQAGAGVVADSEPEAEHRECLAKLAAVEAAIDLAEVGVRIVKLLMLDNYDSFTWNLVHLFEELGADVHVFRNDAITVEEAEALRPDRLVDLTGTGPAGGRGHLGRAHPALGPRLPTLGVCLGHQAIVEAFGGSVGEARSLLHGKASVVHHDGLGVFAGCPSRSMRVATTRSPRSRCPSVLVVTARTDDGEVMGVTASHASASRACSSTPSRS